MHTKLSTITRVSLDNIRIATLLLISQKELKGTIVIVNQTCHFTIKGPLKISPTVPFKYTKK